MAKGRWLIVLTGVFIVFNMSFSVGAETNWPTKAIEFVVPWKAGGGSDTMSRFLVKAIKDNQLSDQPIVVINKPGGSAQIGSAYVLAQQKSAHTLLSLSSAQIIGPLAGLGTIKVSDLTPLAQVAADTFILVTRKDAPFQTLEDALDKAQKAPRSLKVGGTGTFSDDHLCNYLFEKATNIKTNYIAFNGGGEVMSNLLGGHVDVAWANPNECLGQIKGGLVRALAISSENRLGGVLNTCPTFTELGKDMVFYQIRGVLGAPDMPEDAKKAAIEMIQKATETVQWREGYLKAKRLEARFIGGEAFEQLIQKNEEMIKKAVAEMKSDK